MLKYHPCFVLSLSPMAVEVPSDFTVCLYQCTCCKYLSAFSGNVVTHQKRSVECSNAKIVSERFYQTRHAGTPAQTMSVVAGDNSPVTATNNTVINNFNFIFAMSDDEVFAVESAVESHPAAMEKLATDNLADIPATIFRYSRGRDTTEPQLQNVWLEKSKVHERREDGVASMGPKAFAAKELPRLLEVLTSLISDPHLRDHASLRNAIAKTMRGAFGIQPGKKRKSHTLKEAAKLYGECNGAFTESVGNQHKATIFPMIQSLVNEVNCLPKARPAHCPE